jgi:P4 family phage/plasmid primase-like protien
MPSPITPTMLIDVVVAEKFLSALRLGPDDNQFIFHTLDDDKQRRSRTLNRVFRGSVVEHLLLLTRLNSGGAGIFVQINAGAARGADNITALRAIWYDCDQASAEPPFDAPIIVESSRWKWHGYWPLIPGEDLKKFKDAQHTIAAALGTDKSVNNLDRIMRLPGSWWRKPHDEKCTCSNLKHEPFRARLHKCDTSRRYTIAETLARLPPPPAKSFYVNFGDEHAPPVDAPKKPPLVDAKKVAEGAKVPTPQAIATATRIRGWLIRQSRLFVESPTKDNIRFRLLQCPRNPQHKDAQILALANGAIFASCFHDSCFDDQTEVLTLTGFVPFAKVTDETEIATRNEDGCIEYHRPIARQRYRYRGKLLHFKGRSVDLCVTPDHALFTAGSHNAPFRRVEARVAREKSHIYFSRCADWKGVERATYRLSPTYGSDGRQLRNRNSVQTIPMDDWLALFGWYIAEGSYSRTPRNYTVVITQKKRHTRDEIIQIAERAGFHAEHNGTNVRICSKQLYEYLRRFGHAADKFIPREFLQLPKRQLKILFDALMAGDGNSDGSAYSTISRQLANDVQEIAIKLGMGATVTANRKTRAGNTCYRVNLGKTTKHDMHRRNVHEVDYDGEVFDVTVPNHVLMVRRNGRICWSGNCAGNSQLWRDFRQRIGNWYGDDSFERADHVELANRMLEDLRGDSPQPLRGDQGKLFRFENDSGVWAPPDKHDMLRKIASYAGRSKGEKGIVALKHGDMHSVIRAATELASDSGFLSSGPPGIAFSNGFLRFDNDGPKLVRHSPDNYATDVLPFAFDENAKAPTWDHFFHTCFLNDSDADEKIALLQEFVGVCLIGRATTYQRALMLTGLGGNGKSKFIQVVQALFPARLRSAVSPHEMLRGPSRAKLVGVRLNVSGEVSSAELLDTAALKAIISGDSVSAEPKYQNPFEFSPTAGHIFSANTLPHVADHTDGFWDKFLIVEWNRDFRKLPDERDKKIAEKIIEHELPGVAAWAAVGARRLLTNDDFTFPRSHLEAHRCWRFENDPVAMWIDENCERNGAVTAASIAYRTFCVWTQMNGYRVPSMGTFGRRLRELGIERVKKADANYYSLTIRNPAPLINFN